MDQIVWLDDVRVADAPEVGDAAANLGELLHAGFPVATGFVVTSGALRTFIVEAGIDTELAMRSPAPAGFGRQGERVRDRIRSAAMPRDVEADLLAAHRRLAERLSTLDPALTVRVSLVGHDGCASMTASTTVVGAPSLVQAVQAAWTALFDERMLIDRAALHLLEPPAAAVVVQEMVPVVRSGTLFSVDVAHDRDGIVLIEAAFGRGPDIWTGPPYDTYLVDRETSEVVECRIAEKTVHVVVTSTGEASDVALAAGHRHVRVLTDDDAGRLAQLAVAVEACLGRPQMIDWGVGPNGGIDVVRARPLHPPRDR